MALRRSLRRRAVTDATAIPVNLYQNARELMVVAPMPGIAPEDISVEVTEDGALTLRAAERGMGQERIEYVLREWSYGPYERRVDLPVPVDATRANISFGNGVLTIAFPKVDALVPDSVRIDRTGHARGLALGHPGTRGGAGANPA
jgi:HSP20 family protein